MMTNCQSHLVGKNTKKQNDKYKIIFTFCMHVENSSAVVYAFFLTQQLQASQQHCWNDSLLFVSRVELHAVTKTKALGGHDNLCDRKEKTVNPGHPGTPPHCLSANQYHWSVVTQGRTHRRETSTPREDISRTRYHQNGDISLTTLIDDFDWRLWLNALWFNARWFIALWLNMNYLLIKACHYWLKRNYWSIDKYHYWLKMNYPLIEDNPYWLKMNYRLIEDNLNWLHEFTTFIGILKRSSNHSRHEFPFVITGWCCWMISCDDEWGNLQSGLTSQ